MACVGSWVLLFSDVQNGVILLILLIEAAKVKRANAITARKSGLKVAKWVTDLKGENSELILLRD